MLGYPNNKEKMSIETFGTIRDFNKKFPSKLYICTRCRQLTPNPYYCINCENQSNNFMYRDGIYKYQIMETSIAGEIFEPIELQNLKNRRM